MASANYKILLVEDDQNFGDVLRSYLEMHDYDVTLATDGVNLKVASSEAEYEVIINALRKVNFNKSKAAELLGIDRKTLYNKMRNSNIW